MIQIPMLIQAKQLSKTYQKRAVLQKLDLCVEANEIVSFVGASGAGKSTLLHILGTLDTADEGQVLIDGTNPAHFKGAKLAHFRNKYIGFIFQFHNLLPEFTVLENIMMPALLAGSSEKQSRSAAQVLLEKLSITTVANQYPSELSGGEQQRTAVARALINQPKIVLADEPSGNLDEQNAQALHQLFLTLRQTFQQTFVIVTHNKELAALADRSLELREGILHPLK
jgi:lipoprotein-releasing system ATP-binding protein